MKIYFLFIFLVLCIGLINLAAQDMINVGDYPSIQQAIDANPNRMVYIPAGEHHIDKALRLGTDQSGLYGFGSIIQDNPDEHIIVIDSAADVRIRDLILTRRKIEFGKRPHAVYVKNSKRIWLTDLKILNNRSTIAAVEIQNSDYCRVEGCEIVNYKTIRVDDRMNNDLYRYAFNAIDGHGLVVSNCNGTHIIRNRIIEEELLPTAEMKEKYELGKIVNRAEKLGELAKYGVENNFVVIWHQGAGMRITGNKETSFNLVDGNYIERAAQGMDFHTDHVIITNNRVTNSYMGMKAMHGSRNVIIANNVFEKPGKYGLLLRPGSESHHAGALRGSHPATKANVERGIIVSNNIFADMGYGDEHWRLQNDDPALSYPVVIKLGYGPLEKNPTLEDVIIEGNIIYDKGRDGVLVNGMRKQLPPHYKYAVWFDEKYDPATVYFNGNIFHPGINGVSNKKLQRKE